MSHNSYEIKSTPCIIFDIGKYDTTHKIKILTTTEINELCKELSDKLKLSVAINWTTIHGRYILLIDNRDLNKINDVVKEILDRGHYAKCTLMLE